MRAAGALPALVALFAPGAPDVAFSGLAAPGADLVAGAVTGAGAGAAALVPTAGIAVANARNGAPNVRLAQPSANAARSNARLALSGAIRQASGFGRITRFD